MKTNLVVLGEVEAREARVDAGVRKVAHVYHRAYAAVVLHGRQFFSHGKAQRHDGAHVAQHGHRRGD